MHKTVISRATKEIIEKIYGIRTPLPLHPGKFAHVVIDLQNGFMKPGSIAETPSARLIVPNVNRISTIVRGRGGVNIFLRFTFDPSWTNRYSRLNPDFKSQMKKAFVDGGDQHELWSGLDVRSEDVVLNKTRFSAFTPGSCELNDVLRMRGIDTILITGCFSNGCCESTSRDAVQMNYNVIFVTDANATVSDPDHNGTVNDLYAIFGCDICDTVDVLRRLESNTSAR